MKKILGLDLGTNSIGWAVIDSTANENQEHKLTGISSAGSRIIPMDAATLGDFAKGNTQSQTAERTRLRGTRRLLERCLLRRERLLRVLSRLDFLPAHYASQLSRYCKFINGSEPKIAWRKSQDGKFTFLFKESFNEMLCEFNSAHPHLMENGKKIPYDWTFYYLRKKALQSKISKEELAWILLGFNQKRGYYQLRGEEESSDNKKQVKYRSLKVISVEDSGDKKGDASWYNINLENGLVYRRLSNIAPDWAGKTKDFIITTDLDDNGNTKTDKYGNQKISIRAPHEDDWGLLKIKTQEQIENSGKTVGEYIYDSLLDNPMQKIRGKLVHTIDRKFYKSELVQILEAQKEFHDELRSRVLLEECAKELYPGNEAHSNVVASNDFTSLFVNDILFYQRPLKSKKSLIDNCPYESRAYRKDGKLCHAPIKCISKSHPRFQEFRLWQFVSNLRIFQRERTVDGKLVTDYDVTNEFLPSEEDYAALFEWLNHHKSIDQKALLAYKPFNLNKKEIALYRWNYVEDKAYPCNETRAEFIDRIKKSDILDFDLTQKLEEDLWHILYSISDKDEIAKALRTFASKNNLTEAFAKNFAKMPPFKNEYAAYSLKAINKLLPLMRMGKYWSEDAIDGHTKERIHKIINGECDEKISDRVREKAINLPNITSFKGLPVWLACYIVYDRHSEGKEIEKWETPEDIDHFLKAFKQHSLRNPIVEQVITETLRTVRDIWRHEGHIDEIHVELGRDMKNPADKRKKMAEQTLRNEYTNLRIKALLAEFADPEFGIENVRPYSPTQQEILRIYEEHALLNIGENETQEIIGILKKFNETSNAKRPTRNEVKRYKLWLEQSYRSPYTGNIIPLGKLFTPAYEIEHVIPQSRYFDDSLSNKVICESAVNRLKGNMLGYEFIREHHGEKVELGNGHTATIFSIEEYERFVKLQYGGNRTKKEKLLMNDIPEKFIERQLNDSRYISKVVKSLLSNIVREKDEQEATSKNLITCTGGITDRLKKDWGIQDVWNKIILPRFIRMNRIDDSASYTTTSANGHLIPSMPLALQKGFNKKRIDHRHHAMDAIVIACASRNIINYLNNASARKGSEISRIDLRNLLCDKVKCDDKGSYSWLIRKPWETYTQDVYNVLLGITPSFKQNLRVINRTSNRYIRYSENGKKEVAKQTKGDSLAIRKPMHKDTVFGEVNLRKKKTVSLKDALSCHRCIVDKDLKRKISKLLRDGNDYKAIAKYFDTHKDEWQGVNLKKIDVYYFTKDTAHRYFATRKPLDTSFTRKKIENEVDENNGIQKILLNHLLKNDNNAEVAFSPEGIEQMNLNITELNDGKPHKPIFKVRVYERAEKFAIGEKGNKSSKFVEAAKGTNLFFAVYENEITDKETGKTVKKRSFCTIPLNMVINRLKKGLPPAPENEDGKAPEFVLSPNDLVYLPTDEEFENSKIEFPINPERIYKVVSFSSNRLFLIPANVASVICDKKEYNSLNKIEVTDDKVTIKDRCIPLTIDRLGNISLKKHLK